MSDRVSDEMSDRVSDEIGVRKLAVTSARSQGCDWTCVHSSSNTRILHGAATADEVDELRAWVSCTTQNVVFIHVLQQDSASITQSNFASFI